MKKLLIAIAACLGLTFSLSAKNEDNGFGLKFNFGIAGGSYSKTYPMFGTWEAERSGTGGGLTLDSRWYIKPQPKWGIAVNARWLDIQYMSTTVDAKGMTFSGFYKLIPEQDINCAEFGLLGVGPLFSFYPGHNMAIDAYYNIVPTIAGAMPDADDDDDDITYAGFGVAHHVGAAFRIRKFQVGAEYRFGTINVDNSEDDASADDDMDAPMNQFRIFLGFKF